MVGYQHADPPRTQLLHDLLNVHDGERIYAREGLVQQYEARLDRQASGNLGSPPFAPEQMIGPGVPDIGNVQLIQQRFQPVISIALF